MSSDEFLKYLSLPPDAGLDVVESRFLTIIMERVRTVSESYDADEVRLEEEWIRQAHRDFFEYCNVWALRQRRIHGKKKEEGGVERLREDAKNVMEKLQGNMVAYAICHMHITRYCTLMREELEHETANRNISEGLVDVKWSSDMADLIAKTKKARDKLEETRQKLDIARPVLEPIQDDIKRMQRAVTGLYGDKADPMSRAINSGLRTGNFGKARKAKTDVLTGKKKFTFDRKSVRENEAVFEKNFNNVCKVMEENQAILSDPDGRLWMTVDEIDVAKNVTRTELGKIRKFMAKYYFPYMQHKVTSLNHLRDKLSVVVSLNGLLNLYSRLVKGMGMPITNLKDLREFESDVIERAKYLVGGQFEEIPKIMARAEGLVAEFRSNRDVLDALDSEDLDDDNSQTEAMTDDFTDNRPETADSSR